MAGCTFEGEGCQSGVDIDEGQGLYAKFVLFHMIMQQELFKYYITYDIEEPRAPHNQRSRVPSCPIPRIKLVPNSTINVTPLFVEGEEDVKISTIKFDPMDRYIAAGSSIVTQLGETALF